MKMVSQARIVNSDIKCGKSTLGFTSWGWARSLVLVLLMLVSEVGQGQVERSKNPLLRYNTALKTYISYSIPTLENRWASDSLAVPAGKLLVLSNEFIDIANEEPSLYAYASFYAYKLRFYAAMAFQKVKQYDSAEQLHRAFIRDWGDYDDWPVEEAMKSGSIVYEGRIYKVYPATNALDALITYHSNTLFYSQLSAAIGYYGKAINLLKKIEADGKLPFMLKWTLGLEISNLLMTREEPCKAAKVLASTLASSSNFTSTDLPPVLVEVINKNYKNWITTFDSARAMRCIDEYDAFNIISGAKQLPFSNLIRYALVAPLAEYAYKRDPQEADLCALMIGYASEIGSQDSVQLWYERLTKVDLVQAEDLSKAVEALSKVGSTQMATNASERYQTQYRKENTHLALAFNPFSAVVNNELALSATFIQPWKAHEIRLNVFSNASHIMYSDQYGLLGVRSSGYQLSYSFKSLTPNNYYKPNSWIYAGPELQYSRRTLLNHDAVITSLQDTIPVTGLSITPVAEYYSAMLTVGYMRRFSAFYVDAFVSTGLGYKHLDVGFEPGKYAIGSRILNESAWNKVFIPGSIGIKIGLFLF